MSNVVPLNPSGLCMCGCRRNTDIAKRTDKAKGITAGDRLRYVHGHQGRKLPFVSLQKFVTEDRGHSSPCWIWNGARDVDGYGAAWVSGRKAPAHRAMYEFMVAPVSNHMVLDHLCRVPACVNPDHLEPVTPATNLRRGSLPVLDEASVRGIRAALGTQREIAKRFNVCQSTVGLIRRGKIWVGV